MRRLGKVAVGVICVALAGNNLRHFILAQFTVTDKVKAQIASPVSGLNQHSSGDTRVLRSSSAAQPVVSIGLSKTAAVDSPVARIHNQEDCAILFFGLPRRFNDFVLPSLIPNVLEPNKGCDIFVHFYHRTKEAAGRKNAGGVISDPEEIRSLEQAVRDLYDTEKVPVQQPLVEFKMETEETFWEIRNTTIQKYRTSLDNRTKNMTGDGKLQYLYFPWKDTWSYPRSLDNVVRQWHSIQAVWELMEAFTKGKNYTRVGMFRSDVMYVTPIDMFNSTTGDGFHDAKNKFAIVPSFARWPVNDRMIYGPYAAVKVWATRRFELIEEHVKKNKSIGFGMHSEQFLAKTVFPVIVEEVQVRIKMNPYICFFRTRVDGTIITCDCQWSGKTIGFEDNNSTDDLRIVEGIVGRKCKAVKKNGPLRREVKC